MCGRYYISEDAQAEIQKILKKIDADIKAGQYKTGEYFPNGCRRGLSSMPGQRRRRNLRLARPCGKDGVRFLPSSGFYEWQQIDASKPKTIYLFTLDE